jgi:ribosomal protein S19
MKRSKWKAYELSTNVDSYDRSTIILPTMINSIINVDNGKNWKEIKITVDHVGHRLGEFNFCKVTPRFKRK